MNEADPAFAEDVRRRLEQGRTPELSASLRRRSLVLPACAAAVVLMDLGAELGGGAPLSSPYAFFKIGILILLVAGTVYRYRRLAPAPAPPVTSEALARAAAKGRRCAHCQTIVLPGEDECPNCGAVEHGGRTLAFGILCGLGMFALALWRAGLLSR